jgi:endoglucanase
MTDYFQCLAGTGTPTPTPTTTPGTTPGTTTTSAPAGGGTLCAGASRTKFTYFGVNESGAEFGDGKIPVNSLLHIL